MHYLMKLALQTLTMSHAKFWNCNVILFYRKSYLDIEDLKRCNQLLNQHFSEDELEGLLELAGKSDGKITFENFTEFLNNDN